MKKKKSKEPTWSSVPEYLEWKRWRRRRFLIRALVVFILLKVFVMHGCYGPYRGVVLDKNTGEPVEGVVVMATYYRTFISPGGDVEGAVLDAQETVTDEDGEFLLWPKNVFALPGILCWFSPPEIRFVKPHYFFEHYRDIWQSYYSWIPMTVRIGKINESDLKSVEKASWSLGGTGNTSKWVEYKIKKFRDTLNAEHVRLYELSQKLRRLR